MFRKEKDVAGPHVIEKTDEHIRVRNSVDGFYGKLPKWRCKYCGKTGTHPDDDRCHNMNWKQDCEEFEVLDSEKEALK